MEVFLQLGAAISSARAPGDRLVGAGRSAESDRHGIPRAVAETLEWITQMPIAAAVVPKTAPAWNLEAAPRVADPRPRI